MVGRALRASRTDGWIGSLGELALPRVSIFDLVFDFFRKGDFRKLDAKHGQIGNLWLMDLSVPTEETLREMCESHYHYLVGAPHGHLKVRGDRPEKAEWVDVQPGIRVKSARAVDENGQEGDLFVLTHSATRSLKETAMRARKRRAGWLGVGGL